MVATIEVFPNKPSAVGLKHPNGPVLTAAGALWPQDSFTARRLTDRSVTLVTVADPAPTAEPASPSESADPAAEHAHPAA